MLCYYVSSQNTMPMGVRIRKTLSEDLKVNGCIVQGAPRSSYLKDCVRPSSCSKSCMNINLPCIRTDPSALRVLGAGTAHVMSPHSHLSVMRRLLFVTAHDLEEFTVLEGFSSFEGGTIG